MELSGVLFLLTTHCGSHFVCYMLHLFGRYGYAQERGVWCLLADLCPLEVLCCPHLGLNQVVTVDGGGNRHLQKYRILLKLTNPRHPPALHCLQHNDEKLGGAWAGPGRGLGTKSCTVDSTSSVR